MSKGLSTIVTAALLIVMSISIISVMSPWLYDLVSETTNSTASDAQQQIKCRNAGIGFDSGFGYYGIEWNFTGNGTDLLRAKVTNTGNLDLWGLSFEVSLDSASGEVIYQYETTSSTAILPGSPLRPSRSAIISANITSDINSSVYSLKSVRILNGVCQTIAPSVAV